MGIPLGLGQKDCSMILATVRDGHRTKLETVRHNRTFEGTSGRDNPFLVALEAWKI